MMPTAITPHHSCFILGVQSANPLNFTAKKYEHGDLIDHDRPSGRHQLFAGAITDRLQETRLRKCLPNLVRKSVGMIDFETFATPSIPFRLT